MPITKQKNIVLISATPSNLKNIKSTKEYMVIKDALNKASKKELFNLDVNFHVHPDSFFEIIDHKEPWIIHFSGHGYSEGQPILETIDNNAFITDEDAFLELLLHINGVKCIFISACNSSSFIKNVKECADYCIGFENEVPDDVAICFSKHFYKNLFNWGTIPFAFVHTIRELRWKKVPSYKAVFSSKTSYIMEQIILNYVEEKENNEEVHAQILKEIEELKVRLNIKTDEQSKLILNVLKHNPYANFVYWFQENKDDLAKVIANKEFTAKNKEQEDDLAFELELIFEFLYSTLANFDYKGFSKKQIKKLKLTFDKPILLSCLDSLIKYVPKNRFREDTTDFLEDNIKFIKGLL